MLVERPLAETIFRTWLRQISRGLQYTAGGESHVQSSLFVGFNSAKQLL